MSSAPYLSIEWNGNMFVVADTSNSVYKYSYDGVSWSNAIIPDLSLNKPYNAKWLGDKMVITGNLQTTVDGNVIITSKDGINYSVTKTENGVLLRDVETNLEYRNRITFPHTVNLAVGGKTGESTTLLTKIAYSLDNAVSWAKTDASTVFSVSANDAVWNGHLWVAVGEGTGNTIAISTNGGEKWRGCGKTIFSTRANSVYWSNEQCIFVAVGTGTYTVATSVDGIFWLGGNIPGMSEGKVVEWNGEIWVAGGKPSSGDTSIAYSPDGKTWTSVSNMFSENVTNMDIEWNGSYWSVFGTTSGTSQVATSSDGINWTLVSPTTRTPTPFYNDMYFLKGNTDGTYTESTDNASWLSASSIRDMSMSAISKFVRNTSNQAVASIQPLTIATGEGTNTLAYSADGIYWTGLGTTVFTTRANKSVWNGRIWVAVGTGGNWVATSYDGLIWKGRDSTLMTEGYDVAWNGTMFIAVGLSSTATIARSTDGITWTPITNSKQIFTTRGSGIAWTGRTWFAYGSGENTTAFSDDGITWSATSPRNQVVSDISSVFNGNYFSGTFSPATTYNVFTASASNYTGTNYAANAFDTNLNTRFTQDGSEYNVTYNGNFATTYNNGAFTASGQWLQLELPTNTIIKYYSISLRMFPGPNTVPKSWILLGSPANDSNNFTKIHEYANNSETTPNNILNNDSVHRLSFNLFTNTTEYKYYRFVFLSLHDKKDDYHITSCDLYTDASPNTNTLSPYQKPIVLKNNVLFTRLNAYTLADLSLNILNPPTNGGSYVSSILYNINDKIITSTCFDGERFFITNVSGGVAYMSNNATNTHLNTDILANGANINSGLTRLYGSCWNQQFVLFCGGTGTNTGGITYGRLDSGSSTWQPTNASQLFGNVYGVASNSGYGFTYVPNAVYLQTNEILRVVGPKSYTSPGETDVKFNLRNSNIK